MRVLYYKVVRITKYEFKDLQNDWINEFSETINYSRIYSAESEAQMMETAQRLKKVVAEVPVFRAEFGNQEPNQMVSKE